MNEDAASLSRLHDLVAPAPTPWWPLAPGWYVVMAFAAIASIAVLWRARAHWRANAYRREALNELASTTTVAGVSELLRRTALVVAPRPEVASLAGAAWPAWLAERSPTPMPDGVSHVLANDVYRRQGSSDELAALRDFAASWIRGHTASKRVPA